MFLLSSLLALTNSKGANGAVMTITGAFIGGPANMISAAITADLGRQEVLAASDQALSTVTGIVDGTGSFGAAIGQVLIPVIQKGFDDWRFVFYFFILMVKQTFKLFYFQLNFLIFLLDFDHLRLHFSFVHSRMSRRYLEIQTLAFVSSSTKLRSNSRLNSQ